MGMLRIKVKLWLPVGMACLAFVGLGVEAQGQAPDALPSAPVPQVSAVKFAGGVEVQRATAGPLPLSLDDAIARGIKNNLVMELSQQNERAVKGQVLTVGNYLLPNMTASGHITAQEINLAAEGFKPGSLVAVRTSSRNVQRDCEGRYGGRSDCGKPAAIQCAGVLPVPSGTARRVKRRS